MKQKNDILVSGKQNYMKFNMKRLQISNENQKATSLRFDIRLAYLK